MDRLGSAQRVLVIGHASPDGDAIGSVAGLVLILRKQGKKAVGCIADGVPWFYRSLLGEDLIRTPDQIEGAVFDTVVAVDSSDLARLGDAQALLRGGAPDIVLDHHRTNRGFGRLNYCDPDSPATALIVYEIAQALVPVDVELAQILLLGIATDTGFFKYGNSDHRVLEVATELVKRGASLQRIASAVLENKTPNGLKLLAKMLDTVTLAADGKLAYGWVSAAMLSETGCTQQEAEGFVGEVRALHGVEVALLFVESPPGEVHVSLRSKSHVDVSEIAVELGGGGHPRAAGCLLKVPGVREAVQEVVPIAIRALQ
ncbi:MAG: bifunctional oligoribonuclease/PAP phosphatase NrnA [Candidatus Bipolaricaulota bacterium]|nr:bifunctional oligoribonuclease/PAP phosphatase NrnA [Candidatus Bipolaricaulota bacterium]